jgi:Undecaprenyl-phosphate glucose phosphotransferase
MSDSEQSIISRAGPVLLENEAAAPRAVSGLREEPHHSTAPEAAPPPNEPVYSPIVLAGIVRVVEVVLIAVVGFALCVEHVITTDYTARYYLTCIGGISLLSIVAFQAADIYQVQAFRGYEKQYMRLASAWSVVFLLTYTFSLIAGAGDEFSGIWLGSYYVIGLVVLVAFRRSLFLLVRKWTRQGRLDRRTVVVGAGASGDALVEALSAQRDCDVRIVGVFDDRTSVSCDRAAKLGTVDDLVEFARRTRVDLIIFSLPISAEKRILQMLEKLWVLPADVRLAAHSNKMRFRPRSYSYIGNVPLLDIFDRPIADWDVVIKWLFDKVIGLIALLCAAPLMLLIAVAIKLDSKGPILFKQQRYGFNNKSVTIYKFRSLYVEDTDEFANKQVTKDDRRVTRVGRFIRRTSLDELPQLFNVVFTSELSLVGPRPHAIYTRAENQLYDEIVDGYFARHRVKPGITGWAQINGWRGETDNREKILRRVEHDLYYIENWSLLFDLSILLRTPLSLIRGTGAY